MMLPQAQENHFLSLVGIPNAPNRTTNEQCELLRAALAEYEGDLTEIRGPNNQSLLMLAFESALFRFVPLLMMASSAWDLNEKGVSGRFMLHWACEYRDFATVTFLWMKGQAIRQQMQEKDRYGCTPFDCFCQTDGRLSGAQAKSWWNLFKTCSEHLPPDAKERLQVAVSQVASEQSGFMPQRALVRQAIAGVTTSSEPETGPQVNKTHSRRH